MNQIDNLRKSKLLESSNFLILKKSFNNVNGHSDIKIKRIESNGKTGNIYLNDNGKVFQKNLNSYQLRKLKTPRLIYSKLFTFPKINYPFFLDSNLIKKKKKNYFGNILLILIFILLVYISLKLSFKK